MAFGQSGSGVTSNFKEDYWIREGELVLEVAQRIRTPHKFCAEVTLLREDHPINPMNGLIIGRLLQQKKCLPQSYRSNQTDHALTVRNRAMHCHR